MILVIDVGNSRMKWGLAGPRGWLALGVLPNNEIGTLALRDWQNLPRPVARGRRQRRRRSGARARRGAARALSPGAASGCPPARRPAGVVNRYARPEQLGADRWASLVAARQRVADAATGVRRRASSSTRAPRSRSTRSDPDGVVSRRRHHAGPAADAARARRQHQRAAESRRASIATFRRRRPMRSIRARCRRSAARSS